jgi:hypothetical protein
VQAIQARTGPDQLVELPLRLIHANSLPRLRAQRKGLIVGVLRPGHVTQDGQGSARIRRIYWLRPKTGSVAGEVGPLFPRLNHGFNSYLHHAVLKEEAGEFCGSMAES